MEPSKGVVRVTDVGLLVHVGVVVVCSNHDADKIDGC